MSSIYKKDGYYYYQIYLYDSKVGRKTPTQISLGTKIKTEGMKLKKDWDTHFDSVTQQNPFQRPPQPLTKLVNEFIEEDEKKYQLGDLSQSTLRFHRENLNIFLNWYLDEYGNKQIQRIGTTDINEYLLHRKRKGLSPNTVSINLRNVRTFFKWCVKVNYLTESPFTSDIEIPSYKRRSDENVPDNDDWKRIYDFTEKSLDFKPIKNGERQKWDWFNENWWFRYMVWILLNMGMRIGEVRLMKWKKGKTDTTTKRKSFVYLNKDLTEMFIYFKGSDGTLTIPPKVQKVLKELKKRNGKEEYVFQSPKTSEPLDKSVINKSFRKYMVGLGLVDDEEKSLYTPHSLRHSFVSQLLQKNVPLFNISKILRHSSIRTTSDIYGHLMKSDMLESMEKIGE